MLCNCISFDVQFQEVISMLNKISRRQASTEAYGAYFSMDE